MPELQLQGLRSRPLVGYLKSLGVLRVLAHQADAETGGRWTGGRFELSSQLDADELKSFLLEGYAPSPVLSPWNGGSGFYSGDRQQQLKEIESSDDPRLTAYRRALAAARETLDRNGIDEKPNKDEKIALIRELRRTLPDAAIDWIDTAVVLTGLEVGYPPLLGSGGNDGRFDFSNNYAHSVCELLSDSPSAKQRSASLLDACLDSAPARLERKLSLAHFLRDASPVNSPSGESDSLGNPWDLVLGLEGALVLCAGAARRHGWGTPARLVAPFTAQSTASGYGSAVVGERGRDELWLPLWSGWATLSELEALAREARAEVGRRRARSGLDFARAAGELGVTRGISAFERYAILERAGQSSLAVPAGRLTVAERPAVRAIRSLDGWLGQVLAFARANRCPRSVAHAAQGLERSLFALAEGGDVGLAAEVLERTGTLEGALSVSAGSLADAGLRPLGRASAGPWLAAADDGSPEFAVAGAIASLQTQPGTPRLRDCVHGTATDERGHTAFDPDAHTRIPRRTAAVSRLAAMHSRLQVDDHSVSTGDDDRRPGHLGRGLACDLSSLHAFALGHTDDERVMRLVAGLCLLDFSEARLEPRGDFETLPCPSLDLLALAWHGLPQRPLGPQPGWAARLERGRVREVLGAACLRLRLAELTPLAEPADLAAGAPGGTRLSAALLAPIAGSERLTLARRLTAGTPDVIQTTTQKETT